MREPTWHKPYAKPRVLALWRPLARPDGTTRPVLMPACKCEDRRGPVGGVCGNCGDAIPDTNGR